MIIKFHDLSKLWYQVLLSVLEYPLSMKLPSIQDIILSFESELFDFVIRLLIFDFFSWQYFMADMLWFTNGWLNSDVLLKYKLKELLNWASRNERVFPD
jgi:hypothetical protein